MAKNIREADGFNNMFASLGGFGNNTTKKNDTKKPAAKSPLDKEKKAEEIIKMLYGYYMDRETLLPIEYIKMIDNGGDKSDVVCDYIAGMTDNYAIELFEQIYIPKAWSIT